MSVCQNCEEETEVLYRIQGYQVCESCAVKAGLPWWDR